MDPSHRVSLEWGDVQPRAEHQQAAEQVFPGLPERQLGTPHSCKPLSLLSQSAKRFFFPHSRPRVLVAVPVVQPGCVRQVFAFQAGLGTRAVCTRCLAGTGDVKQVTSWHRHMSTCLPALDDVLVDVPRAVGAQRDPGAGLGHKPTFLSNS